MGCHKRSVFVYYKLPQIWDVIRGQILLTLSSHTQGVASIKWSGDNLIYSASQDRTIKVQF